MVLPAFTGDTAVVDGVYGTMVVTGETAGTLAVMEPLGRRTLDIVDRTDLHTLATLDADIGINHELLVSNHPFVEIATDDIGIKSRGCTLLQRHNTLPAVSDGSDNLGQLSTGVGNLRSLFLLGIRIHERQADIRLGHDDGVERISM